MRERLRLSWERLDLPRDRAWRRLLRGLDRLHLRFAAPTPAGAARVGREGEDIAYWALRQHGYTIVARNYRRQRRLPGLRGELDLVAFEGAPPVMVFVEVKTRSRQGRFPAEQAVDQAKRRHLVRMARDFRRRRGYTGPYRFDVLVVYDPDSPSPRLELHRAAFHD